MNREALSFLKALLATPTPSGFETEGQGRVAEYMGRYADIVKTDVHGNVHGIINPDGPVRVMLAGHCDEIGLMVQHIDDKGFLYVSALGGVNVPLLQGERILIQGRHGPVPGVVGVRPIHLMTQQEREKSVTKIHELWVDIGAKNRKDAEKAVALGDTAVINTGWNELRNGLVACRAFDNRIGAFIVADVLRAIQGADLQVAVHAVSTVQEEVGLRGATTAAFGIDPHIGIAVDVGFATDFPEMDPKITGAASLNAGPVLHPGPTYNPRLLTLIRETAAKAKLKTQLQPEPRGANTDAYAMHMTRAGAAAALISVPCRYMHSPVETIALRDATDTVKLIAAVLKRLTGGEALR